MKKLLMRTTISIVVGGLFFFLLILMMGAFGQTGKDFYQTLSNAAFVVGVLMAGFGLLAMVSKDGSFDALAYSMSRAVSIFGFGKKKNNQSFFEYKQQKQEKAKGSSANLLLAGLVWIGIAAIFLALYNAN